MIRYATEGKKIEKHARFLFGRQAIKLSVGSAPSIFFEGLTGLQINLQDVRFGVGELELLSVSHYN